MNIRLEIAGVNSLLVRFTDSDDNSILAAIAACRTSLQAEFSGQLIDLVPSYTTLLITYDLLSVEPERFMESVYRVCSQAITEQRECREVATHCLPICYQPEVAEDLIPVAEQLGFSVEELITIHSEREYKVYAVGFAPGFAYLGDLDPRLHLPRLATPRLAVPAGSLAIADKNTAVYPQQSPGGWHLIGRCPLLMFNRHKNPPVKLQTGDKVCFDPVDLKTYQRLLEV